MIEKLEKKLLEDIEMYKLDARRWSEFACMSEYYWGKYDQGVRILKFIDPDTKYIDLPSSIDLQKL
jgi:hypothetical protein